MNYKARREGKLFVITRRKLYRSNLLKIPVAATSGRSDLSFYIYYTIPKYSSQWVKMRWQKKGKKQGNFRLTLLFFLLPTCKTEVGYIKISVLF